ncbi:MAG: phosphoadenylyl-sulfate reductase [Armatimonadota bacterium]|nr:phosphoadenylyl-sulfate reductase [Armatimonadota bacterium]
MAVDTTGQVRLNDLDVGELATLYDDADAEEVMEWAFDRFGDRIGVVTSFQREGMVLLDMAHKINPKVRVITVDTARMPSETYTIMEMVRERYGMDLEIYFPEAENVEKMVQRHGPNLFYNSVDLRLLCCHIRKVLPLQRALNGIDCWITGLRRAHWATRANLKKIEMDHDHDGIIKLIPLADWTDGEVLEYIQKHDVPCHPLYEQGYTSISCAPCTRPISAGEDSRAGRWWWEKDAPKECGMHCSLETGGFEHEVEAILGANAHR